MESDQGNSKGTMQFMQHMRFCAVVMAAHAFERTNSAALATGHNPGT